MRSPLLTVVTVTFNAVSSRRKEFLERCIRSVDILATAHEHLLFDGGSKDGTVEWLTQLIERVDNSKIKLFSVKDKGIYDALNKGVAEAKGEWLYVLGDDDYLFDPGELDRHLRDYGDDYDMIVSFVRRCDGSTLPHTERDIRTFFFGFAHCHQGVLMRTDLARRLCGFDLQFKITADYDLVMRAHLSGVRTKLAWAPYANFTMGGVSDTDPERTRDDFAAVLAKNFRLTEAERHTVRYQRLMPIGKMFPLMFRRDPVVRKSAIHQVKRSVANCLGLLKGSD